MENGHLVY